MRFRTSSLTAGGAALAAVVLMAGSGFAAETVPAATLTYSDADAVTAQPVQFGLRRDWGWDSWADRGGVWGGYPAGFWRTPRFHTYGYRPGYYEPFNGGYYYEAPSWYVAPDYSPDWWDTGFHDPVYDPRYGW